MSHEKTLVSELTPTPALETPQNTRCSELTLTPGSPGSPTVRPRSGEKYRTAQGVTAISRGMKASGPAQPRAPGSNPAWMTAPALGGERYAQMRDLVKQHGLNTVCREAHCPNIGECWNAGTATFMLLGAVCTRACRFCAVDTGNPRGLLDAGEPERVAQSVRLLGLGYVVLTSVNRDDLPDGGADHFARTVQAIRQSCPATQVEALVPDFLGRLASVDTLLGSGIAVFAQNVETVERLTHAVRDARAGYRQTLNVLAHAKRTRPDIHTKTGVMVGLGETDDEMLHLMDDLRAHHVDILTIGQYLQPTRHHLPVQRWVAPERFEALRHEALQRGFAECVAGPLVRSSYRAERFLQNARQETGSPQHERTA